MALGLLASLVSARARWRAEWQNRQVEITLDYAELRDLAAAENRPLPDVLREFRRAGATSVTLQEETITGLEDARRIEVVGTGRRGTTLRTDAGLAERVDAAVRNKRRFATGVREAPDGTTLFVPQPLSIVRGTGVGLDPESVAEVRAAGLEVVGRVSNWEGVTPAGLAWTLRQLKQQGVATIIFSGDEVLGFKGYVAGDPRETSGEETTESVLRGLGLNYGTVEFVKQRGDALLARRAQDRTVRVHTVSGAELLAADIPANVQRFLLAARERNIRLLFVRVFPDEPDAVRVNAEYVEKIARGLRRGALSVGPAHRFGPLETPPALRLLMGLGIAAAWCLLLDGLTRWLAGGTLWLRAAAFGGGALLALLPLAPGTTGPKLAAFAAACVFPTLALTHTDLLRPAAGAGAANGLPANVALEHAFRRLLAATGITLLGAATIVGLLSDRLYLIKADAFMGIKASQLLPVVIVAAVYFLGLWASADRPWPRVVDDTRRNLSGLGARPILWWQVAVALAALVALAVVVLRSGNDPGVGVSPLELRVRGLLDRLLTVRPRFKEFLIGHPALVLAFALAAGGRRTLAFPLLLVGAIGQASLLNTFCHLHTPLAVSLLRALLGFAIGVIIGVVAFLIVDRFLRRGATAALGGSAPRTADAR